jgi:hypothetical protein
MRLICAKGLWKGILQTTADPSLCPAGCVALRPSMKKGRGGWKGEKDGRTAGSRMVSVRGR